MHVEKYTKTQTFYLLGHYSREHKSYENKSINTKKTHLNYNLNARENDKIFLEKRLSEVKVQKRADINLMCDWAITLPKGIENPEHQRQFFEATYSFFKEKYGEKNIISAWVHVDESQPHMHFCFIPVVYEAKRERYKVCAKELITKAELKKIHSEVQTFLSAKLSFEVKILREGESISYKKVEELKLERELESMKKLNESLKKHELATTAALIKSDRSLIGFFTRAMELVKNNVKILEKFDKNRSR